jgi:L-ribulose-5-phosphate 3-epimerase
MNRRNVLKGLGAAGLAATTGLAAGKKFPRERLAILTDEAALTPEQAIDFAKQYQLKWVELRDVPGIRKPYFRQSEALLKQHLAAFKDAGLKVSFLNTPFFKSCLPESKPLAFNKLSTEDAETRRQRDLANFEKRFQDLEVAVKAAHVLEVDKIRVFGFLRVEKPESTFQQIADILGEYAEKAQKEGIRVLVENEASCNVGTTQELVAVTELLPENSVGMNWDPGNALFLKEKPFPDGYELLTMRRLANVQIKGKGLLDEKEFVDWQGVLTRLAADGYTGKVGLETHYFDGTVVEKSHLSMKKLFEMTS